MEIHNWFDFNAIVDGQGYIGKVKEFTQPEVVAKILDHVGAGTIGTMQIATGHIEAMTARILWAGYYREALELAADPFRVRQIQLRGSQQVHNAAQGLVAEREIVAIIGAKFNGTPTGALVSQEATTIEQNLRVNYYKVSIDGEEVLEIDVAAAIWRVKGVDIRAQYRRNLGL